jgi:HAD superfamily hydrolase (TIGR01509 family)
VTGSVPRYSACLIDVYQTVLTNDFVTVFEQLAEIAGVPYQAFREVSEVYAYDVTVGAMRLSEVMTRVLGACGVEPRPELVAELVAADQRLLIATTRLYDDTLAFLEMLQQRGVKSALVSNCAENTRPLLVHLGLDRLVDALVLSCEVGAAKPSPPIYLAALRELGAAPRDAIFVDDQAAYCRGAEAVGIAAAQIIRREPVRGGVGPEGRVVRSLVDLDDAF